jgi:hypothetical protein
VGAAKPSDHGWRIPSSRPPAIVGSRRPAPVRAEAHPAAIVEGSKPPRGIILPGPSPRVDPYPVAIGVWRPARRNSARNPHRTVVRGITPGAVVVQVFRSDNVRGNVTGGYRIVFSAVAQIAPLIEPIGIRRLMNVMRQRSTVGETCLLVSLQANTRSLDPSPLLLPSTRSPPWRLHWDQRRSDNRRAGEP